MMDDHASPARRAPRSGGIRAGGIPLGRVLGTPVRLSTTWLLLAALVTFWYGQSASALRPDIPPVVGYGAGFGLVLFLVGSVLLHELGHAVVARHFGIGVRGITLEALGGYTEMEREAPKPSIELAVSMAGPLVSLGVAAAAWVGAAIAPAGTLAHQLGTALAACNAIVAVFNALPGLPLDGGRALLAVVWAATGDPARGRVIAGWGGRVVALITGVAALSWYAAGSFSSIDVVIGLLVAYTIWSGAGQSLRLAAVAKRADRVQVAQLTRPIVAVTADTSLGEAWGRVAAVGLPNAVVAVADEYGQVVGLLHQGAAERVPPERRSTIPVGSLTREVAPSQVVAAHLRGIDLLRAVGDDPGADYLVLDDEDVIGVLRGADLISLLESNGLDSRRATP